MQMLQVNNSSHPWLLHQITMIRAPHRHSRRITGHRLLVLGMHTITMLHRQDSRITVLHLHIMRTLRMRHRLDTVAITVRTDTMHRTQCLQINRQQRVRPCLNRMDHSKRRNTAKSPNTEILSFSPMATRSGNEANTLNISMESCTSERNCCCFWISITPFCTRREINEALRICNTHCLAKMCLPLTFQTSTMRLITSNSVQDSRKWWKS
mmetsp:Transcript_34684/g.55683  ORF Transcript_34684/g.55683 Transcript_34684/m.55683 type:complete len:210 (+) Transcript_34684:1208-1837(+)